MRTGRIVGQGCSYYHCMSRIIERRFLLGDVEKEYFMRTLRALERFTGVEVLTHCLLDNHFHLLLKVGPPPEEPLEEREVLSRVEALYGEEKAKEVEERLGRAKKERSKKWYREELEAYTDRMYDLSVFMKELKQRFSQWFNRRNERKGPLWEERFKSVLVEGADEALTTMATYIDLNPVRAGLCEDPGTYRWCGYGAATGGDAKARRGLQVLMEDLRRETAWRQVARRYRVCLFGAGEGKEDRKGFDPEKVREVLEAGGALSRRELLLCRVRYFTDGVALGSKCFVDEVFHEFRDRFGKKRKDGGRRMKGGDWEGLFTMRDLRKEPVAAPG